MDTRKAINKQLIVKGLIIGIFVLNIATVATPLQIDGNIASNPFFAAILTTFGFEPKQLDVYQEVPILTRGAPYSVPWDDSYSSLDKINLKLSEYYVSGWADTRWQYRKNITINYNKVSEDCINFPLLINLYDSDLQKLAQASGNDIMFTDADGLILDHEIENYERIFNSTHAHLVAWVKTNLSSTQNTIISMYYGNSAIENLENQHAVWAGDYVGVWHLSEETGNSMDSTSYGTNGAVSGGVAQEVIGQIGYCYDFTGTTGSTVNYGDPMDGHLDFGIGSFTISYWVNVDQSTGDYQLPIYKGGATDSESGYDMETTTAATTIKFSAGDGTTVYSAGYPDVSFDTWTYMVGVVNRPSNYMYIYQNGNLEGSYSISSLGSVDTSNSLFLSPSSYELDGMIDEVRLYKSVRSVEWIQTEYNNQYDPSSFYSIAIKEEYGASTWSFNAFRFKKNITVDPTKVSQDLTNFPLLIDIFDTDLHDKQRVQPDGDDIIFVDDSGARLDHEIELFDQVGNGTHAHLVAWVRVPFVSNTLETSIIMYYGNPAVSSQENPEGVWNSEYLAVHHLKESPTTTLYDSTDNDKDLITTGSMTVGDLVDGQLGKGIDFDNYNDAAFSSTSISLNQFTFSAWINPDTFDDWDCAINVGNYEGDIRWFGLSSYGYLTIDNWGGSSFGSALSTDEWYYIVVTYDGTYVRGYVDGGFKDSDNVGTWGSIVDRFSIGAFSLDSSFSDFDDHFDGILDEIRILNIPRSAGWISSEYENQKNPETFYSIGQEVMNGNWWVDASFNNRKDIVISHNKVAENLTNFPVLVELSDTCFKLGKVQTDGSDILFVDNNGSKLAYEIESFSQNNTHGVLIAWVKLPLLSAIEDTIISIYFGNPNISNQANPIEVWHDYRGVWHLGESSGNALDSTSYSTDGSVTGAIQGIMGQVDGAYDFDGIDDRVLIADPTDGHLDFGTESFSFSLWVNIGLTTSYQDVLYKGARDGSTAGYTFYRRSESGGGTVSISIGDGTDRIQNDFGFSSDEWIYVVGVADRSTNLLHGYKNGIEQGSGVSISSLGSIDSSQSLLFGDGYDNANAFVDEIRISSGTFTSEWIETEFNNQFEPETFYTVGPQISLTSDIIIKETVHIGGAEITQLTTPNITPVENDFYLLSVSMKPYLDITSVTGMGLTWIELEDQPSGRSQTGISLWYALGLPTSGGVTVTLASQAKGLAISLSRISGVNPMDPIGITETANTNGIDGSGLGGTDSANANVEISSTTYGSIIWGAAATRNQVFTPAIDYTQIDVISGNSDGDEARVTTFQKFQETPSSSIVVEGTNVVTDWAIAGIEIKPNIIDINPPIIEDFGVDDKGDGNGVFWAKIYDKGATVNSATIRINQTQYNLIDNGTHWIYQSSVNFLYSYYYEIINCTDTWENSLAFPTIEKSHVFIIDHIFPSVQDWEYYDDIGPYGSFKANVSDNWGVIDTVILNVTEAGGIPQNDLWARMQPTASGYLNDTIILPSGTIKFVVKVNDTAGNSFTSSEHQSLVAGTNHAPFAENITLSRNDLSVLLPIYSNSILYLKYDFFDADVDPDQSEILWYKNGVHQATYDDLIQIPASALVKGDQWNTTIHPYDGQDYGDLVLSPLVIIQNTPPSASNVVVLPSSPLTTSTLSVSYSYSDYDGDSQNTGNRKIIWYKDGILQGSSNNSLTISSSLTSKGEEWYYELQVNDGTNYSSWTVSSGVIIANSAPSATVVQITPGTPVTGTTLTASYTFSDVDYDSESGSLIRWYKNSLLQVSLNDSLTVDASFTLKGESWYYTIRPSDGITYGTLKQAPSVVIGNTAPTASVLQITPGSVTTINTLTANYDFYDDDLDIESGTNFIWYKDGILQGALNDSDEVTASYTAKGQEWHFKVRPSDGVDSGIWYSCPINVTIQNTGPSVSNLALTPSSVDTTDDLLVSYDYYDADFDSEIGTEVLWYLNGILQVQLNDSLELQAGNTTKGQVWHVKVRVFDGTIFSNWVSLGENKTILNSVPILSDIRLNGYNGPTQVSNTTDLLGSYIYFDADNDAQINASREIYWYRKIQLGSTFELQVHLNNSLTVGNGNTTVGDTWYFIIRVFDGTDYSSFESSPSVSIGVPPNTPPEAQFLNITPSTPVTTDALIINWTFFDMDADEESGSIYYWYCNGIQIPTYNGLSTLPAFATTKGEVWHVKVRPRDGKDFGLLVSVPINVTIGNTAPEANTLEITPSSAQTANDLSADFIFFDIDGDSESGSNIIWYVDGVLQGTLNGSFIIDALNTQKEQEWHFKIQPKDGTDFGAWISCPINITIGNTAPIATSLTISPVDPKTTDDLSANYIFSDADEIVGDSEMNSLIRWFKNGVEQTAYENQTIIPYSETLRSENWWFEVTPFDGADYGSKKVSPLITIGNTAPTASNLQFTPSEPKSGEDLTVSYMYDDLDNDFELGTQIYWLKNGILESTFTNSLTVDGAVLVKGDEWNVSICVSDGFDYSIWYNDSITIVNTLPIVVTDSAEIFEPSAGLFTTSSLTAIWNTYDADGDLIIEYKIVWKNRTSGVGQFAEQSILENMTVIPPQYTHKNQDWRFEIQIFDGEAWSLITTSFLATIQNSEPNIENIMLSGGKTTTDPISVTYDFFDADSDPDQSEILWGIFHITIPFIFIPGSTTLSNLEFAAGDLIWVEITPDDNDASTGQGTPVDTSKLTGVGKQIQVGDTAPQINTTAGLPIINADHPDGITLYTVCYPLYINYSMIVYDIDSGESSSIFDVSTTINDDVLYSSIKYVVGAQYRWYKFNPGTGLFELQPSLTNMIINPYYLHRNDQWMASVRPRDNYGYYGNWVNTTPIIIGNSYPQVTNFQWGTSFPTTTTDLTFTFTYYDYDGDPMITSQTLILWYKNGVLISGTENQSLLLHNYFIKGDNITVIFNPSDGTNWSGRNYTSIEFVGSLFIVNSRPVASDVNLTPLSPTTIDNLELTWIFTDADNDVESINYIIEWRQSGVLVPELANLTSVPSSYTSKGETWQAQIWVFDGEDYSYIGYISNAGNVVTIQNTQMEITEIRFSGIDQNQTIANDTLSVEWDIYDSDNDGQVNFEIYWFCDSGNGTFIARTEFDFHTLSISSTFLIKGQFWYCKICVYDGEVWSENTTSNVISIINAAPWLSNLEFYFNSTVSQVEPDIRIGEFYVEDEDISISFDYHDIDNDSPQVKIEWFKIMNGSLIEIIEYENASVIPSELTSSGEQWFCRVTPFDGFLSGTSMNSTNILILNRPVCNYYEVNPITTSEGMYNILVNVPEVDEVEITTIFFDNITKTWPASNSLGNNWTIVFLLEDLQYLDTYMTIVVKSISSVLNDQFEIYSLYNFIIKIEDKAPPRVLEVFMDKNDPSKPTNLTFTANIQEFGIGIVEVLLYYYFSPVIESGGNGANYVQIGYNTVLMNFDYYNTSGEFYVYKIAIDFVHNNTDTDIIYWISTTDNAGNNNPLAFDIRDYPQRIKEQRFVYTPPGLPEWVLLIAGIIIFVIFIGAVVYVKFIRKPELVGLDKELVLNSISEISETEINESIDEHTIGIMISYFDQRHGPIPIVIAPEILKDNFNKLVELSDRSFSGTGFCDNFENEIPSSYDFVLDHGVRSSILSFGYALNRPEARGGQENITLNILGHQELFPLIQAFQKSIQNKVHEIHKIMDDENTEKDVLSRHIIQLRNYISSIILSYVKIYGTTDLLEEENY